MKKKPLKKINRNCFDEICPANLHDFCADKEFSKKIKGFVKKHKWSKPVNCCSTVYYPNPGDLISDKEWNKKFLKKLKPERCHDQQRSFK